MIRVHAAGAPCGLQRGTGLQRAGWAFGLVWPGFEPGERDGVRRTYGESLPGDLARHAELIASTEALEALVADPRTGHVGCVALSLEDHAVAGILAGRLDGRSWLTPGRAHAELEEAMYRLAFDKAVATLWSFGVRLSFTVAADASDFLVVATRRAAVAAARGEAAGQMACVPSNIRGRAPTSASTSTPIAAPVSNVVSLAARRRSS